MSFKKELDRDTNLYYYGARYYNPKVSVFLNVDPLAEQTMEPYAYVGNNPVMFVDPTGMSKEGGRKGKYFGYSSNIRSVGNTSYYRTVNHTGNAAGYKTIYSKGFLPGSTQRSHNHFYATQKGNFKGGKCRNEYYNRESKSWRNW